MDIDAFRNGIAATLLVALVGCQTHSEPTIRVLERIPVGGSLYLVAAKQKEVIEASLHRAGVEMTDDLVSASAIIRVTLGAQKNSAGCGEYSNINMRCGGTGNCSPNSPQRVGQEAASLCFMTK